MTESECRSILARPNAAIIAPAGHGKTEMIVNLVAFAEGKQLLLTHTNAGVDALQKRLNQHPVSRDKYTVTTIAAFCTKWCNAYSRNAEFDRDISPVDKDSKKQYYQQLYQGPKKIFAHQWAKDVLQATYTGIIIDEYQDCIQTQHEIFLAISVFLPVRVLGDPLQGIFEFAGALVDWNDLGYEIVSIDTYPWRWEKTNCDLGAYLMTIRQQLIPTLSKQPCNVQIHSCNGSIELLNPQSFDGYTLLKELQMYNSVLYVSRWPKGQLDICKRMPGIFQYDEKQDCDELFAFAENFDSNCDSLLAAEVITFASICATEVSTELKVFANQMKLNNYDFSRIKNNKEFGEILTLCKGDTRHNTILKILDWISQNTTFKQYRTELYQEMIRSVKYAQSTGDSIYDTANYIRKDIAQQKRYTNFKYLSSRTLLSKGLEFDCVIIDMSDPLSAKEFYVAMTRAMKKIYILSNTSYLIWP